MKLHLLLAILVIDLEYSAPVAIAAVAGPYAADENTLALFHFNEDPGAADPGNAFVNFGTAGAALDLTNTGGPDGRDNFGLGGYGGQAFTGFGSSFDVLGSGDGNRHGTTSTLGGGALTAAANLQGSLQGASGAFTYEAIIRLGGTADEQNILSHDGSSVRGFLFRVIGNNLALFNGSTSFTAPIPTSGDHAFVANEWFHAAVTYSGDEAAAGNLLFYWTRLDSPAETANLIGTPLTLSADLAASSSNLLGIGTTTRSPFRFEVAGLVDEARISSIARGADDFLFVPEPATAALFGAGALAFARRRRRF